MIAVTLLLSLATVVHGASPGRAILWSGARSTAAASSAAVAYKTQSSTFNDVHNLLQDEMLNKDMTVLFCSEQEQTHNFFTAPHFSASIKNSVHATVMPNVYHASETRDSTFCSLARDSPAMKDHQTVSVENMLTTLSSTPPQGVVVAKNNKFIVSLQPNEAHSVAYEKLLSQLHQKNALIVGLQEPQVAAPATKGHYSRLLEASAANNYNPEGTEFTIYYQNTYLYLTPDLFTGLMTFLFCSVVLLIGFSCLNKIQGPSTFVHVMPTLGKEG